MDADRVGAGTLLRGGIAGGGPRDVIEFWDGTRGGTCGSFPLASASLELVDVRDVTLEVRCKIDVVTFDMDWEIELCVVFVCGWTVATVIAGFCGGTLTIVCVLTCDGDVFDGVLLLGTCFAWGTEKWDWKKVKMNVKV